MTTANLLPATARTQAMTLNLAKLAPGNVKLLVGTPNLLNGGKTFRFANMDQDRDRAGGITLGTIVVP